MKDLYFNSETNWFRQQELWPQGFELILTALYIYIFQTFIKSKLVWTQQSYEAE